jgi:hypothetical protein
MLKVSNGFPEYAYLYRKCTVDFRHCRWIGLVAYVPPSVMKPTVRLSDDIELEAAACGTACVSFPHYL